MEHVTRVDMMERSKGVGWVVNPEDPKDEFPLLVSREGRKWLVYAGTSDEYRGEHGDLIEAMRLCTRQAGWDTGTMVLCLEYQGDQEYVHNL